MKCTSSKLRHFMIGNWIFYNLHKPADGEQNVSYCA